MVMTRPPAYHPGNFLMKNMNPTNSGLSNHDCWLNNYMAIYSYTAIWKWNRLAIIIGEIDI